MKVNDVPAALERAVQPLASQLADAKILSAVTVDARGRGGILRLTHRPEFASAALAAQVWSDGWSWLEVSLSIGIGAFVLDDFEQVDQSEFDAQARQYVRVAAAWMTAQEHPWEVLIAPAENGELVAVVDGLELRLARSVAGRVRRWFGSLVKRVTRAR